MHLCSVIYPQVPFLVLLGPFCILHFLLLHDVRAWLDVSYVSPFKGTMSPYVVAVVLPVLRISSQFNNGVMKLLAEHGAVISPPPTTRTLKLNMEDKIPTLKHVSRFNLWTDYKALWSKLWFVMNKIDLACKFAMLALRNKDEEH